MDQLPMQDYRVRDHLSPVEIEESLRNERERQLRFALGLLGNEDLQHFYIEASGTNTHAMDCATSCAPAMRPRPCDCTAEGCS